MCVFHQTGYINLLKLLVTSISVKANINRETTDILIITSPKFQPLIQKELEAFDLPLHYYILDLHTLFDAGCSRLNIFKYDNINLYDKILYLDTDILINNDINTLFDLEISSDKIYALEEGNIGHEYGYWGSQFFDFSNSKYNRNQTAFTSGILYFKRSEIIINLFDSIQLHIKDYIYNKRNPIPTCLDQPFIVYNAIIQDKYNNQLLKEYIENNPTIVSNNKIIYHFPGDPGSYNSKYNKMANFWSKINILKQELITLSNTKYNTNKLKICQYGTDGFGHQLEGMLRLISLSLNNKAEYIYKFRKSYSFDHKNIDIIKLNEYLFNALKILSEDNYENERHEGKSYNIIYRENRIFDNIILNDKEYDKNIYFYDGVGCGSKLPPNFENIDEVVKSLPKLRNAFVYNNSILPKPSYDNNIINICCHIRLGDAIGTRVLDNNSIFDIIKHLQKDTSKRIIIHSDGDVNHLKSDNTIIFPSSTDVLQILSDFIHSDILIMNYSSLSIAAHLLAKDSQKVICPNKAGVTFYDRILKKCIKIKDYY